MEFRDSPFQAEFRKEVAAFIEENAPPSIRSRPLEGMESVSDGSTAAEIAKWYTALGKRGWLAPHWPKEFGGAGMSLEAQVVLNAEVARAGAPRPLMTGIGMFGPTLIVHGTDEQKREHLPGILDGSTAWVQGYSEPGSGSDLASLQTRAVRVGDEYVVNGQKIWTSNAHNADMMYMLARTDPEAPKHRGISYLMLDMKAPGVTVRPLINMADEHVFNEVFFEDVHVPVKNRVGDENRGWYVGTTTLDYERSTIGSAEDVQRPVDKLVEMMREGHGSAASRMELADRAVECEVGRLLSLRVFDMQNRGLTPNAEASMTKLFVTELRLRIARTAMKVLGAFGQATYHEADLARSVAKAYLTSTTATIAGGTSEVQRNIIATRGLGLPRG